MPKSILYHLFGAGCVPDEELRRLQAESELLREEGLRASITYRDYRAKWQRCKWRRKWFVGSIMLTSKRIVAFAGKKPVVNIEYDDPRMEAVKIIAESDERLLISFDTSEFHTDQSGTIELRYSTPETERISEIIASRR
ncbi:MAG: hypothetical protein JXM70_06695 [Pirellulales bacterium]|nr:hypothetical protein [Pirellulales bacterium]